MKKENVSRRNFVKQSLYTTSTMLGLGVLLNACGNPTPEQKEAAEPSASLDKAPAKENQCEDFSEVSKAELAKREQFGYVEETAIPESKCNNCQLWIMPKEGEQCGGCMLFKGPVHDDGHCAYWAPQV